MKTSPTLPLSTLLLLLFILGQSPVAGRGVYKILKSGVYIVTLVSDPEPSGQTIVRLLVNFKDTIVIAYGDDNVIGALSVAIPLKRGDFVGDRPEGKKARSNAISFSVAFVGSSKDYFATVRSNGWLLPDGIAGFDSYIAKSSGSWTNYAHKIMRYKVPIDGVYWIVARPDGSTGHWTTVNMMGLFNAYSGFGVPISASGAFYLTTKDEITMKVTTGQRTIESATMMSWVYLENNTPDKLDGTYMAYTDTVPEAYAKDYGENENVAFGGSSLLDRGNMYYKSSKVFRISITGTYILSLRGNPAPHKTLRLQVYRNDKVMFQSFAQRGVSSGQAKVFELESGDRLYVRPRDWRHVGKHTMISIAILHKETKKGYLELHE